MKKNILLIILLIASLKGNAQHKENHLVNVNSDGVILDGYDPVAFFTLNKPVKGQELYSFNYHNAKYLFADSKNRDLFISDPAHYEVQFGGYCAYAVSLGRTAPIDVNTFSIVNNRLVVQHNERAVAGWNKDINGNIFKADKYWPEVVKNNGRQVKTDEEKKFLVNTDKDGVILQGYDVIAYFTDKKAVKGNEIYTARYNGATYWFASQAHADQFKDHPEMYAPQFGAFCGYAVSLKKLRPVNPEIFQVTNGKLILQHTQQAYDLFNADAENNLKLAEANWPELVKRKAGKKVKYDKPAKPSQNTKVTAAK